MIGEPDGAETRQVHSTAPCCRPSSWAALTRRAFDLGGEVGQSDLRRCNRTLPAQRHAIDQQ